MKLSWYYHRLSAMSLGEIYHRAQEKVKKISAKSRHQGWESYINNAPAPVLAGLTGPLKPVTETQVLEVADAAKRINEGEFFALGVKWPTLGKRPLFDAETWRLDPVTGRLWPDASVYCFDIPYRHETTLGDIKYAWEYNRLQFLQPLAAHVNLTSDKKSIATIEAAIISWYESNPPFGGIAWNSGIELSLRSISLLTVTSLCGHLLSQNVLGIVGTILSAHYFWLRRFPSEYSSANNHLIAELAALYLISNAMPSLPSAGTVRANSFDRLTIESQKQILSDGVGAEQSPTYAAFTAEFLLLCAHVAKQTGNPFPDSVDSRLEKFALYIAWISNADGWVPQICDDDEGRVLNMCLPEMSYACSVANSISAYLNREIECSPVKCTDLRTLLFGAQTGSGHTKEGVKSFLEGGYTVIRERRPDRNLSIILDHGPLGYLSIAAHGHADALAILLSINDQPILVDPGTFLYHSGGEWRDWFRSTPAHNTVSLNGVSQSTMTGPFNWSSKANSRLDVVEAGENWKVVASHDGYKKDTGTRLERTVSCNTSGFTVVDRWIEARPHVTCDVVFQFADNVSVSLTDQNVATVFYGDGNFFTIVFSNHGHLSLSKGGALDGGWISLNFGTKLAAPRLVWRGTLPTDGASVDFQL